MNKVLQSLQPRMAEIFSHLHAHAEISWQEQQTTQYIANLLKEANLDPQMFDDMTGLYVDIGKGTPKVGFRTDIDALWQEVDGVFKANHSCGHDGHMTMAIGTALLLKGMEPALPGAVRILFQPAEEKAEGARALVEKGIIDDLDYLFGVHVRPLKELQDGTYAPALYHGAAKLFTGTIFGEQAHGAWPELGINAIEVGAAIVEGLQKIWTDPNVSASAKMTQFNAGGTSANVIPGKATFSIDARAQTNEVMHALTEGIERVKASVEVMYSAKIDLQVAAHIVAALVHDEALEHMRAAIIDVVGHTACASPVVTPGGEDFHFYTYEKPELKATMLGLGCGVTPGLHHPNMTFNRERLVTGVDIITKAILRALSDVTSHGDSKP
ncbi:M20 peptidase aminoacylase family protein [Lysinibacillus sphaericus]|uniref:Amidohydrolase n=1 Tax=Lysinibacillus sphaericus OT4b.31 TaxID=1285586 RepID=R7ZIM2_LYSSH|nr:M20 peptidase aminoacylase family protein [Lysinibacillus sphaericus]EON73889.1 amidohydrolase [Lysinibacillus sphaericus OT4b.31]